MSSGALWWYVHTALPLLYTLCLTNLLPLHY